MPAPLPLPNLFLIGAMKSATSTLWTLLSEHPEVFAPKVKEIKFFSRYPNWHDHVKRYLSLYSKATAEQHLLDGSPQYARRPLVEGVAKRIFNFNPKARLIYIVRDPFERILSHYRYYVWTGRESKKLMEALRHPSEYLPVSNYAYQLSPYLEVFKPEAIYVLTYESLANNSYEVCRNLFKWLEIDPDFVPPSINIRMLRTPEVLQYLSTDSLRVKLWLKIWPHRQFVKLIPRSLRRCARSLLPEIGQLDVLSPEFINECSMARKTLSPLLNQWIYDFERLLGRNFDDWPTKYFSTKDSDRTSETPKSYISS